MQHADGRFLRQLDLLERIDPVSQCGEIAQAAEANTERQVRLGLLVLALLERLDRGLCYNLKVEVL